MKSIHLSTDLLNYEECAKNNCFIDRKSQNLKNSGIQIPPDEVHKKLINGGLYDKAEVFKSPLFNLGKKLEYYEDFDEIIFSGDARKVDLKWWSCDYFFDQTYGLSNRLPNDSKYPKVLRFENEVEFLNLENFPIDNFILYINNYSENVEVKGIDELKKNHLEGHLFFRAPRPNAESAYGKSIKLTKAYSRLYNYSEYFWSKSIDLHSSAVTYVEDIDLKCYENPQHKGTCLYLIGITPKELTEDEIQRLKDNYPFAVVWESRDIVVNKLKQADWHMN